MTRITYHNTEYGFVTKEKYFFGIHMCVIKLFKDTLEFKIESLDGQLLDSGNSSSLAELKNKVRKTLIAKGIEFADEIRRKTL